MVIQISKLSTRGIWALMAMICLLFVSVTQSHAQGSGRGNVTATLSDNTVALGDSIELQLRFEGEGSLKDLTPIEAEGMEITRLPKQSTSMSYDSRFGRRHVLELFFQVTPKREGKLTIPVLRFAIDGEEVRTQALSFTVTPPGSGRKGGAQAPSTGRTKGRGEETVAAADLAFAEWVIPKRTAFVGEAIPVELRLYILGQVQWDLKSFPSLEGDGYTIQKLSSNPSRQTVERNGRTYDVLIFKTAITPVKAGAITVGAADFHPILMLPRSGGGQRPPRGMFGDMMEEMMRDPMFNRAFLTPTTPSVKSEPVELEVKPLPTDGRPKSFSGAVGRFDFKVSASPLDVRAGDPVTVKAIVSGLGSFERMGAPLVAKDPAWRAYPASNQFFPKDEVKISGSKEFDIALVANGGPGPVPLPKIEFSYFDPVAERYVTRVADPLSIEVTGTAPVVTPTPAVSKSTAPAPTPAAETPQDEILPPLVGSGKKATFVPLWDQPSFWLLQIIPMTALLAWAGVCWMKERPAPSTTVLLRQAKQKALSQMSKAQTEQEFADEAVRALQMESALAAGGSEPVQTAEHRTANLVIESKKVDAPTAAGIREIFALRDQSRYAGTSGSAPVASELRQRLTSVIQQFEKSHHA